AGTFTLKGQGIGVPTLAAVLDRYRSVPLIIEMKVDTEAMGEAGAAAVGRAGAADRVCAAGYGRRCVLAARRALPEMATSACMPEVRLAFYRSWAAWPVRGPRYQAYQVPEWAGRLRIVSPRFIRHAHRAGVAVQVWTIDQQPDMERLLSWGADALISNRPDLAVRVRDAFVSQTTSRAVR